MQRQEQRKEAARGKKERGKKRKKNGILHQKSSRLKLLNYRSKVMEDLVNIDISNDGHSQNRAAASLNIKSRIRYLYVALRFVSDVDNNDNDFSNALEALST